MKRILFLAPLALLACSQPEPVFTDSDDVRNAIMQIENAQFRAHMTSTVEASDSEWQREVSMHWVRNHAANDSTYGMAWLMEDAFIEAGDTTSYQSHLWGNEVTYIRADSSLSIDPLDPRKQRNGNGIGNYYASLALSKPLTDSTWWAEQVSDSLVGVEWEHVLPSRSTPEQFILTSTSIPDSTDEDYHPDSYDIQKWAFQAPHGLPVHHELSWYRGDMGYGSDMNIEWTWENVNQPAVVTAIADWMAPDWAKEPEPVDPAVAGGGGSENWFEEALASLPAIGAEAPAMAGLNLDGEPVSLEALQRPARVPRLLVHRLRAVHAGHAAPCRNARRIRARRVHRHGGQPSPKSQNRTALPGTPRIGRAANDARFIAIGVPRGRLSDLVFGGTRRAHH